MTNIHEVLANKYKEFYQKATNDVAISKIIEKRDQLKLLDALISEMEQLHTYKEERREA